MLKENRIYKFFEQVKQEAFKVVWPSRKELTSATAVVMVVVVVFSVVFLMLDYALHSIVKLILDIGK